MNMERRLPSAERVIIESWQVIMDQAKTVHQFECCGSCQCRIVMAANCAAALYYEGGAKSLSAAKDAILRGLSEMVGQPRPVDRCAEPVFNQRSGFAE
jgi:fructose-1,6-bisphosphatase/inositol monophosphatase family enzyme